MKTAVALLLILSLSGCSSENRELTEATNLRRRLLSASCCSFQANITADYGDELYSFSMDCRADDSGDLTFAITQPETICGIGGTISDSGGKITFEDKSLCFPLLTDDLVSPAGAPWIFLKSLRSGYISSAGREDGLLHICVHDSYEENALMLDIWIDQDEKPVRADILHEGRRILSVEVEQYTLQ